MSAEACAKAPESHAEPRSGLQRTPRRNPALDRVLWTATGITLGAGLTILATFVLLADAYL